MLLKAKKISNVEKKVNPHWLRHSMLSYCVNVLEYNEQLLMWRAGWKDTAMAKRYVHSGASLQNSAYLRKSGYEIEEEESEKPLLPKNCLQCGSVNAQTNKFCDMCRMPLDIEEYTKAVESRKSIGEKLEQQTRQFDDIRKEVKLMRLATDRSLIKQRDKIMELQEELHMYKEWDVQQQEKEFVEEYLRDPGAYLKKHGLTTEEMVELRKRQDEFWEHQLKPLKPPMYRKEKQEKGEKLMKMENPARAFYFTLSTMQKGCFIATLLTAYTQSLGLGLTNRAFTRRNSKLLLGFPSRARARIIFLFAPATACFPR